MLVYDIIGFLYDKIMFIDALENNFYILFCFANIYYDTYYDLKSFQGVIFIHRWGLIFYRIASNIRFSNPTLIFYCPILELHLYRYNCSYVLLRKFIFYLTIILFPSVLYVLCSFSFLTVSWLFKIYFSFKSYTIKSVIILSLFISTFISILHILVCVFLLF